MHYVQFYFLCVISQIQFSRVLTRFLLLSVSNVLKPLVSLSSWSHHCQYLTCVFSSVQCSPVVCFSPVQPVIVCSPCFHDKSSAVLHLGSLSSSTHLNRDKQLHVPIIIILTMVTSRVWSFLSYANVQTFEKLCRDFKVNAEYILCLMRNLK